MNNVFYTYVSFFEFFSETLDERYVHAQKITKKNENTVMSYDTIRYSTTTNKK